MNLDKRQWYVHWFFISLAVLDRFGDVYDGYHEDRYSRGTNLCHFIRVLFLWTPLVIALHILVYGGAIAALTYFPIALFGVKGYVSVIVAVISTIVLIIIVGVLLALAARTKDFASRKLAEISSRRAEEQGYRRAPVRKERRGPSFGEVVWQYLVATKQKICPTISFEEAGEAL